MNIKHTVTAISVGLVTLVGCAGSETTAPSTTAPSTTSSSTTSSTTAPEPEVLATVADDLPEPYVGHIGPVAVQGEALPKLPREASEKPDADPATGKVAPVLIGVDYANNPVRIDPSEHDMTLVVFLAHWCPHCNDELPILAEWASSGRKPDGLQIFGVSTALNHERPNFPPSAWLGEQQWPFPLLADGIEGGEFIALSAYGVSGFPFSVLLDGDGKVLARWAGARNMDDLDKIIAEYG